MQYRQASDRQKRLWASLVAPVLTHKEMRKLGFEISNNGFARARKFATEANNGGVDGSGLMEGEEEEGELENIEGLEGLEGVEGVEGEGVEVEGVEGDGVEDTGIETVVEGVEGVEGVDGDHEHHHHHHEETDLSKNGALGTTAEGEKVAFEPIDS